MSQLTIYYLSKRPSTTAGCYLGTFLKGISQTVHVMTLLENQNYLAPELASTLLQIICQST